MKSICFLILAVLTITSLSADEKQTISSVNQLINESHEKKAEEVWPGFDLTSAPILITFGNGHVYAFNLKSTNPVWKKITVAGTSVLFSEKDHWGLSKSMMNPQFPIEGQNAYAFNLDQAEGDTQKIFEILVHERFHRYQFDHFPMENMKGNYLDELNVDNLALMQMEERALANFFQAKGEQKKEFLLDFAAINQTRRAILKKASVMWEDHQQIMEGLADYVSFKIFDVLKIFDQYEGNGKLKTMLETYAKSPEITERAVKWRHYGVGAAMGYGLDFLHVKGWKHKIEKGASMTAMLDEAVHLTPTEVSDRMGIIEVAYDFKAVREKVSSTVANYQKNMDDLAAAYDKLEGVAIQVGRPKKSSISGGGFTARTLYLADGTTISLQDSSMMTNKENTWCLELEEVPFVFQNYSGEREFKIELDLQVTLDGKAYLLRDLVASNAHLSFNTIELKGKACRFTSKKSAGAFTVEGGKVYITFG